MEAAPSAVEAEPEPAAVTGIEARREAYMRRPINLVFFMSEVDAELPFALREISFKRVGVRSGVA